MSVILVDLGCDDHDCQINGWDWRPILQIIRLLQIFDADRLVRMGFNGGGAEVTEDEARLIAEFLEGEVLPLLSDQDRVRLDLAVSNEGRWEGPIESAPQERLYGASKECLVGFASFCRSCRGFRVY